MPQEIKGRSIALSSGATLVVVPSKYEDTENLIGAFLESLQGRGYSFEDENSLKEFTAMVASKSFTSPKLKAALWKCLERCVYHPAGTELAVKVSPALFDGEGKREDLVEIMYECAMENISPFSKGLYVVSSRLESEILKRQKQS